MSNVILADDPLHLIATYDPEDEAAPDTEMSRSLSRTISREDQETSHSKSPNVYVDEMAGSDSVGMGTKQAPYQSIYGAYLNRGEDIHIFVKRRCVDTRTKYWIPADAGTHVDLMRFNTRDRAAEQAAHEAKMAEAAAARERVKREGPKPSTNGSTAAPVSSSANTSSSANASKEKGGFMNKLKKAFK